MRDADREGAAGAYHDGDPRPWSGRLDRAAGRLAWFLFTVVAALTLYLALTKPIGDYFTETDFYGGYGIGARELLAGRFDPARYGVVGPAYECAVAVVGLSGIELYRAGLLVSWCGGILALAALAWAVSLRLGGFAALAAVLLAATNPTWLRFTTSATTDALFLGFTAWSLALGIANRPLGCGAAAALATLTRYPGVALVGTIGLSVFLPWSWSPWVGGLRKRPLAAFLVAVLGIGGWFGLTALTGTPPKPAFHHNVAYEVFARPAGLTWDDYAERKQAEFPTPLSVWRRDPARVVTHTLRNVWEHAAADGKETLGWPLAAAAALGLLLSGRVRRDFSLAWIFAAAYFLAHAPVFHATRYALPLAWCAAAAGTGIVAWAREPSPGHKPAGWRAIGARFYPVLAGVVVFGVALAAGTRSANELALLAVQWPRQVVEVTKPLAGPPAPKRVVLARQPHAPWYAGGQWAHWGAASDLNTLGERARQVGATHLFVSWPEVQLRPALAFLLLPEFAAPGLRAVASARDGRAVLYAIGDSLGRRAPGWYPEGAAWRNAEATWLVESENREALRAAARGRHAQGSYERAEYFYRELAVREPGDTGVLVELGKVLLLQGKAEPALRLFETLVAQDGKNPDAWRGLAEAAMRSGNPRRAREALEGYLTLREDPAVAAVVEKLRAAEAAAPPP